MPKGGKQAEVIAGSSATEVGTIRPLAARRSTSSDFRSITCLKLKPWIESLRSRHPQALRKQAAAAAAAAAASSTSGEQ